MSDDPSRMGCLSMYTQGAPIILQIQGKFFRPPLSACARRRCGTGAPVSTRHKAWRRRPRHCPESGFKIHPPPEKAGAVDMGLRHGLGTGMPHRCGNAGTCEPDECRSRSIDKPRRIRPVKDCRLSRSPEIQCLLCRRRGWSHRRRSPPIDFRREKARCRTGGPSRQRLCGATGPTCPRAP